MILKCENCNCEFEKPQYQKTCSRNCASSIKKTNNREIRVCTYCKNNFEAKKTNKKKLCSDECRKSYAILPENKEFRIKKTLEGFKKKYGTENIFELDAIKDKSKKTKKERYGDENYINLEKNKQTKKERYGDENYNNMEKNKLTKFENHGDENYNNRDKAKNTMNELYGVDYAIQKEEFKEKQKKTNTERYGISSLLKDEEVRSLGRAAMKEKYGVEYAMQNHEIFQKCLKNRYKILEYKNTGLYYHGSYEKYFLELLEKKGLFNEAESGQSFEYEWKGEKHTYHTDFIFRGKQIEIKSSWTYNNDGKDKELEQVNETKWESVRARGQDIVVLIGKDEIKGFVKGI